MPAASGAAAEVPKNGLKAGASVVTPSMPTMSGLARDSGAGKLISTGPCELYGSMMSRAARATAPTATTPGTAGWPMMLPAGVRYW